MNAARLRVGRALTRSAGLFIYPWDYSCCDLSRHAVFEAAVDYVYFFPFPDGEFGVGKMAFAILFHDEIEYCSIRH